MKRIKNILHYQLPVLFILLLVLPFVNSIGHFWEGNRRSENRAFKDSLSISFNNLDKFPKECEAYVNDNFSFRNQLLKIYHHTKFGYFNVSPHPDQTIIGEDGWFFMAAKEKSVYEGKQNFSNEYLNSLLHEWTLRKQYLDALGIKSYWLIAPMKHYVYSECLPKTIFQSKKRRVEQVKNFFEPTLSDFIIDPLERLKAEKKNYKMYYQLDNHWNYRAGYEATNMLIERVKEDFPNDHINFLPSYAWCQDSIHGGFHYNVMGIDSLVDINDWAYIEMNSKEREKYGFETIPGFAYPDQFEMSYVNDSVDNKLRILIIRDSFGDAIIPFVRETFKESIFVFDSWQYKLNAPIIDIVKPDIVLFLTLETHLESVMLYKQFE